MPTDVFSHVQTLVTVTIKKVYLLFDSVDQKSSKELRGYLSHVAEQSEHSTSTSELPSVIILDSLQHVATDLPEVSLSGSLRIVC